MLEATLGIIRRPKNQGSYWSFTVGWDKHTLANYSHLQSKTVGHLKELLPFEKRTFKYRGNTNHYEGFLIKLENLQILASEVFKIDLNQLFYQLNDRIKLDRNGIYVEPWGLWRYRRPPRLRFHQSLHPILKEIQENPVEKPTRKQITKCLSCGFESTDKEDWEWGFVAGLASSDYISKCLNCEAQKNNSGVKQLFAPFGSRTGTLEIETYWEGRPLLLYAPSD